MAFPLVFHITHIVPKVLVIDGTFDEIKYTNLGGTGFESDNHTIAASYITRSVPESSAVLGISSIAFVGAASVMTRKRKKKTVLEL